MRLTTNTKKIFAIMMLTGLVGLLVGQVGYAAEMRNRIYGIKVLSTDKTKMVVEVDYFYNGKSDDSILLEAAAETRKLVPGAIIGKPNRANVFRGRNKAKITIPREAKIRDTYKSEVIRASLIPMDPKDIAEEVIPYPHVWPDIRSTKEKIEFAETEERVLLQTAIDIIDTWPSNGDEIAKAEGYLGKIISRRPNMVQAYLEMARVKMKSDPQMVGHNNANGVQQAERLINVALKIDPNYVNSYVLLGYVYAVEGRTREAKKVLEKAERMGTRNMWLYYNWGLAYEKEKDPDGALKVYLKGIDSQIDMKDEALKSSNLAVDGIFDNAIDILETKRDWERLDSVYKRQLDVMPHYCLMARYARFLLMRKQEYHSARSLAKVPMDTSCQEEAQTTIAIGILGRWNDKKQVNAKGEKDYYYYQAIGMMPNMQKLLSVMAESDYTGKLIPALQTEKRQDIDERDVNGYTALAYAVYAGKEEAVDRLISYGANLRSHFTGDRWNLLMLAVQSGRPRMVSKMLEKGVPKDERTVSGLTARDIAIRSGRSDIAQILSGGSV